MAVSLISPVMIGRSGQLAALWEAFHRVCAGTPSMVLLGGEAGAGKTRLITEFTDAIAGRAVLLSGGCVDLGGEGLAFAPFTAALRGLARQLGVDRVAALVPGGMPGELGRLLPALGAGRPPDPWCGGDAAAARARLFEELLGLVESLADQQSVVLIVEDGHWADRSSRELLAFLVRNLQPSTAVLIVVSYRTDELGVGHPLRPLLAELERLPSTVRVELPRLSRAELIAQIRAILGGPGPDGLIEEVVRRSDGNPLFVEALLDCGGRLPESLADLLLARLERLPDDTQRVLGTAAVAGARFGAPLLEAVTGLGEAASSECLRPAVVAGVLVTDDAEYAFRHTLMREAAVAGLLPGERRRLHARLAEALEADPALVADGTVAAEIAHHWHAAGEAARALPAACRAAADAAAALAHAEQLVLLDRVLTLWEKVPDAAELTGASRAAVLEKAVAAAYLAGEPERGVALADAAGPAHAWNLAEALTSIGRWDEALEVIDQALNLLPPAAARLQLLRLLGFIALARGDVSAAAAALGDARDSSEGPPSGGSFGTRKALMLAGLEVPLLAAQGDTAAALTAAARVLSTEGTRTAGLKRFLWPLLAVTARVACLATRPGASDDLTALAHDVLRQAAGHAASARPVSPLGRAHAAAYAAAADQVSGRPAGDAWNRVVSAWDQLGEPYRQAQALLYAVEAALAAGADRGAAALRLRQAAWLADTLAARPLSEEILALARRARIDITRRQDASGGAGTPGSAALGLTDRELEVLRLVAAGRNNRDIAAELFISAKTASAHVCNILAKLRVRSRVEAAAIAHRAGLTG